MSACFGVLSNSFKPAQLSLRRKEEISNLVLVSSYDITSLMVVDETRSDALDGLLLDLCYYLPVQNVMFFY